MRTEDALLRARCIAILGAGTRICDNLDHPSFGLIIMAFCFRAFLFGEDPTYRSPLPFATEGRGYVRRRERSCGPCPTGVCVRVYASKLYAYSLYIYIYSYIGPNTRERKSKEEHRGKKSGGRRQRGQGRVPEAGEASQSVGLWPRNNRPAPLN